MKASGMTTANWLLDNLDNADELEALFRQDPAAWRWPKLNNSLPSTRCCGSGVPGLTINRLRAMPKTILACGLHLAWGKGCWQSTQQAIGAYLPIYGVWALLVVFGLPLAY